MNDVQKKFKDKAKKAIEVFNEDLKKIRTGRASTSIFDDVTVDYYGEPTPVNQVATVSVPEARLIVVHPWEKQMLPKIEKAILKAELGLNPSNDGNVIRVAIPALTEETRKEMVKEAKQTAEHARITIRNIRRDMNDMLKKALKSSEITEDDERTGLDENQKLTDKYIEEINKLLEQKEKEILDF